MDTYAQVSKPDLCMWLVDPSALEPDVCDAAEDVILDLQLKGGWAHTCTSLMCTCARFVLHVHVSYMVHPSKLGWCTKQ